MSKLTREPKIELYKKRKECYTISSLSKMYNIHKNNVNYLVKLIYKHGFDILRNKKTNIIYLN